MPKLRWLKRVQLLRLLGSYRTHHWLQDPYISGILCGIGSISMKGQVFRKINLDDDERTYWICSVRRLRLRFSYGDDIEKKHVWMSIVYYTNVSRDVYR